MKLLFCPECGDIVLLRYKRDRTCDCGASSGMYTTNEKSVFGGKAIPIGLENRGFTNATTGYQQYFTGFVYGGAISTENIELFKDAKLRITVEEHNKLSDKYRIEVEGE